MSPWLACSEKKLVCNQEDGVLHTTGMLIVSLLSLKIKQPPASSAHRKMVHALTEQAVYMKESMPESVQPT